MRQLIAIAKDGHVSYLLAGDNGDVAEVARVVDPGFAAPDIAGLGLNLIDALRLNGRRGPATPTVRATSPEPPPRALPPAPVKKAAKRPGPKSTAWAHLTRGQVIDDVRRHPGSTVGEIAERVADVSAKGRTAVSNRIIAARDTARRRGEPDPFVIEVTGDRNHYRYSLADDGEVEATG